MSLPSRLLFFSLVIGALSVGIYLLSTRAPSLSGEENFALFEVGKKELELNWRVGTTFEAFTAPNGIRYENVKISRMSPTEIILMHESGVARIPIRDLPIEYREALQYDPDAERARVAQEQAVASQRQAAAQQAAEKEAMEKRVASAKKYTFKILQITPDGFLVQTHRRGGPVGSAARSISQITGGSSYEPSSTELEVQLLKNVPSSSAVDDDIIEIFGIPAKETYQYETVMGSVSTISVIEFIKWGENP